MAYHPEVDKRLVLNGAIGELHRASRSSNSSISLLSAVWYRCLDVAMSGQPFELYLKAIASILNTHPEDRIWVLIYIFMKSVSEIARELMEEM